MSISELTRRDIFDVLSVERVAWSGRLEDPDFLSRIFDLKGMPSGDPRFQDAYGDIWQHRVNNFDWEDDWVFLDSRFDLLHCEDEVFLRFLCEMLHPVVRNDREEVERLRQFLNDLLTGDGYELVERARISDRPIFVAKRIEPGAAVAYDPLREGITGDETDYVARQITRMEVALREDPGLAIGTAKELVETCCKTILEERTGDSGAGLDLPQLVKRTAKELRLTPEDIPDQAAASNTIRRLLSNLATITQGIAELRNRYGTGHGRAAGSKGLGSRHARLAVGAASTLAVFLVETQRARKEQEAE
jgi:AbiJ N-terminal domain 3/Abortive infection C-terminus